MRVKIGDKVRIVNAVATSLEMYGYQNGEVYEVKGFTDGDPDIWTDGTEASSVYLNADEYEIITEGSEIEKSLTEQLAEAREKVTQLEAALYPRLTKGTVVVTTDDGEDSDLLAGAVARVIGTYKTDEYGVQVEDIHRVIVDWFRLRDVIIIESAAELRSALYAEADRRVAEVFEGSVA